jgi:ABC-2 type transport system permease protein
MKEFTGFIRKEFLHIFRDFRTLIILFGMPVAQILIFGFVIRNELQDVRIAVLDKSKDPVTLEITNKLISSGFFRLYKNLNSDEEIDQVFKTGKVREVVVFGQNFAEKLEREGTVQLQILADASDPNSARMIVNYTQGITANYLKEINSNVHVPLVIEPRVRMMYNADLKSAFMFVPGAMAMILMLVSAMMTSISIAREKETGTMEALLVSPLRPIQIIAGKVTPYILLSFINALVILLMGYFIFNLPVRGSLLLLFGETILFISLALSLGIMISTMSNTQQVAMFISAFALMLPTMLLSGFIFPIENMPKVLQWLCHILPPRYFIYIIRNIMLKGTGIAQVWKETLILAGMFGLFIGISALRFKVRLQQ